MGQNNFGPVAFFGGMLRTVEVGYIKRAGYSLEGGAVLIESLMTDKSRLGPLSLLIPCGGRPYTELEFQMAVRIASRLLAGSLETSIRA